MESDEHTRPHALALCASLALTQGSEEWLRERAKRIGMSTICNVIGGYHGFPYHYWRALMDGGGFLDFAEDQLARMEGGRSGEDPIRQAYVRATGYQVVEGEVFVPRTGDEAYNDALIASLDGRVGTSHLLEIKCPAHVMYDRYKKYRATYGIPEYYVLQMLGQMAITGIHTCHFVAITATEPRECLVASVHFSSEVWQIVWPILLDFHAMLCSKQWTKPTREQFRYNNGRPLPFDSVRITPMPRLERDVLREFIANIPAVSVDDTPHV